MSGLHELLIGQRINSSSPSVAKALRARDGEFFAALAHRQAAKGAHALDLNVTAACTRSEEPAMLTWLVGVVQEASELPLCLDSGDANALAAAAATCRIPPILNSLSPDQIDDGALDRFDWERAGLRVVVLCTRRELAMDVSARLDCACYAADRFLDRGVREEALIFDPLMFPWLSGPPTVDATFDAMRRLRAIWPGAGILCAAGNYSHGLPERRAAERECVAASRLAGSNVFLCDPAFF